MERLSAFSKPEWSARNVHKDPPLYHVSAYVTGGLQAVFKQIRAGKKPSEPSAKHKKRDQFRPVDGQILSRRYRLTDKLSTQGQFAVIVGAKDVFCEDRPVIIKVMHQSFYNIGLQERHCLWRLAVADPCHFSHTVHLLNTFTFDGHFCLVFEFLHPTPITGVFEEYNLPNCQLIEKIRKVAFQLLKVLGFLQRQNTIHADIKPENILLKDVHDVGSLKVIDFGNAIHHIHKEVSLYYHDFELQTLLYRAPEVMFGIPFGTEVDMWSLGCVLAELYLGESLFSGTTKDELLHSMTKLLGRFPVNVFRRGKFFENHQTVTSKIPQPDTTICVMQHLRDSRNYAFANFLAELLRYNPDERLTPTQALRHSFLAPEFSLGYFIPSAHSLPNCIDINPRSYRLAPKIPAELKRQNPSTFDLLKMGTQFSESNQVPCNKIAKVCPFEPNTSEMQSPRVELKTVLSSSRTDVSTQHPAGSSNDLIDGVVEQSYKQKDSGGLDILETLAENQVSVKSKNKQVNSELKKSETDHSDSNICLNSTKLQNLMAMITVEQERVEDLMDGKEKRERTHFNAGVKQTHVKSSFSFVRENRRRKKPVVNSTNFLCEYASSSSESDHDDCSVIEITAQEKELAKKFCLSNSFSQDSITNNKPILPSYATDSTNKLKNESVPIYSVGEIFPSPSKKSLSENNESTKNKVSKSNSKLIKSGLDHVDNTDSEVKVLGNFRCISLHKQNSNRKPLISHSRRTRTAKRKLMFTKAFHMAKCENKANTVKGLRLWNEKYNNAKKKQMKKKNTRTSLDKMNSEQTDTKVVEDDPFEFTVTPLKSSKAIQKAATTEGKKPVKSRRKSQNTVSKVCRNVVSLQKEKANNKKSTSNDLGSTLAKSPVSKVTRVENLDRVFKKYNKMKDISPISATAVREYTPRSEAKRRSLFSESGVHSAHSPCKRKCVQKQHKEETALDSPGNQSQHVSLNSTEQNPKRPRKVPDSNVISDRLTPVVNEITDVHLPSSPSSVHKQMKTIQQRTLCEDEHSLLTTIRSLSSVKTRHKIVLQMVKSRVTESVKQMSDRQNSTHSDTDMSNEKAESTSCEKNTNLPEDDDDIILLEV
ncbi:uncharacterized protein LOC121371678 isoform X2 [Gigantopelta aegis]|uniref:uncharacterized protein LOC121371678 isoform X2 n=1 Tax=Gigantopelta aegis TaxID=1735272 RepID=UPI001B887B18|nr:uncharacterized protein LOC121371678 isoform X2 [Gigantopelta aegis]